MSEAAPFQYQRQGRYFAQTARGLEALAARELAALGVSEPRASYCGVYFDADPAALYRVNYCARLLTRVLAPLAGFSAPSPDRLYERAKNVPWELLLGPDDTFAVNANITHSRIRHSRFAALRVKDAIADRFRERVGRRPNVDTEAPTLGVGLYLERDHATLHADVSGGSLHKRGYRGATVEAPMQETLAAALLEWGGWDGQRPLVDPMCGSGTLLCEALMRAAHIPAAYLRPRFGFQRLPDFDDALWRTVKAEANAQICGVPGDLIGGADADPAAAAAARANLARLPGGKGVRVDVRDVRTWDGLRAGTIVCNPPYGIRLGGREEAAALLRDFGALLRERCAKSEALLYFGDAGLMESLGLKPAWARPLSSGGLAGQAARYWLP